MMVYKKAHGSHRENSDTDCLESIVEILDQEMATVTRQKSRINPSSDEMNALVADLLGSIPSDSIED